MVPIGDDAEALHRCGDPAPEREPAPHHGVRGGQRRVRIAVAERPIGDHEARRYGLQRVQHDLERVVVHLHQLGGVLGEVAVTRHNDRHRLAGVADHVDRHGVVLGRPADHRSERAAHRRQIGTRQHRHDAR